MAGQAPQPLLALPAWASESGGTVRGAPGPTIPMLPANTASSGSSILDALAVPTEAEGAATAESAVPSIGTILGNLASGADNFMSGLTDMASGPIGRADQLAQGTLGWLGPAAAAIPMLNDIFHGRALFPGWQQKWQNTLALFGGGNHGGSMAAQPATSASAPTAASSRPLPPPPPAMMPATTSGQ